MLEREKGGETETNTDCQRQMQKCSDRQAYLLLSSRLLERQKGGEKEK